MAFVFVVAVGLIGALPCLAANGLELVDPSGKFGTVERTVKAKTGEHVGPVGRMEAIETFAVALLAPIESDPEKERADA